MCFFEFCIKKENQRVIHIVRVLQIYQSELYEFVKVTLTNFDYAAKTLLKADKAMRKASGKGASFLAVVCGLASYGYCRDDGVNVIPVIALGV